MKGILALMCLAFIGASTDSELSDHVLQFLYFFNGDMNNKDQYQEGKGHYFVEARMMPLNISAFYPRPAMYIEEAVDGVVQMLQIGVLTDGPGGSVNMQIYNFTKYSNLTPFTYDYKSVVNVKLEDLSTDEDCVAAMTFQPGPEMSGTVPDCRYSDAYGKHPRIVATYGCDSASAVFPQSPFQTPVSPYQFQLLGPKYPLVGVRGDYVNPCYQ